MNKKALHYLVLLALTPVAGHAQFPNMNEEQMQKLMEQGQKMQACFSQIDPAAMEQMAERGKAMEAEISDLCKSGDRDGAESRAVAYAKEMMDDDSMQAMKKCGEEMARTLPQMEFMKQDVEGKERHVCDNY